MRQDVIVKVLKIDAAHNPLQSYIIHARPGAGNYFASPIDVTTAADGMAIFTLTPGLWEFSETAPNGMSDSPVSPEDGRQNLNVIAPGPHSIRFKNRIIDTRKGCIEVIAQDEPPAGQQPIGLPGWFINVLRTDGSRAGEGQTDATGRIVFNNLPLGPYTVHEQLPLSGWEAVSAVHYAVTLTDTACEQVEFSSRQVEPAFCIVGRTVDTNGLVGLPSWEITAKPTVATGYTPDAVTTDGLGYFRIDLPTNDYRIPGAEYTVCETEVAGWLARTATCQKAKLPTTAGNCVALDLDFENQQVGQAAAATATPSAPIRYAFSAPLDRIDVLLIADAGSYRWMLDWKKQFEEDVKTLESSAFPLGYETLHGLFRFHVATQKGRIKGDCDFQLVDGSQITLGDLNPSMDVAVLVHRDNRSDCSTGNISSTEYNSPLTFLHELGHSALALADEYGVGANESTKPGGYWLPPNIGGAPTPNNIYRIRGGDHCPSDTQRMNLPQNECQEIPGITTTVNVERWSRSHTLPLNLMRSTVPPTDTLPPFDDIMPPFGDIIKRGILARLQWALDRCANNDCGSVGRGSGQAMGGHEPIFVNGDHEPLFVKGEDGNQQDLSPRSLLLVLQFSGAEIEVLEQRLVDGPTRDNVVQSVPQIQVEVGSNVESYRASQRYYIWDPRIGLLENDNDDTLSGEIVILDPVIFDIVVPLDESFRPRVVRLRYPVQPTLYPGWEEDPEAIDFREKVISIAEPGPLTLVVGWPRQFFTLNPFVMGVEHFYPSEFYRSEIEDLTEGLIVTTQILEGLTQAAPGVSTELSTTPDVSYNDYSALTANVAFSADVRPLLADSFAVNDDASVWTFYLREGVFFHDGTPLTSAAVEANYRRWLEAGYWSAAFDDPNNQTQFVIIDDFTFQLIFETSQSLVAKTLAQPYFVINSPAALEKFGDAYGTQAVGVVGTGPFRYGGAEGNRLLLTRFGDYWGTPAIADAVVFRYLSNPEERLRALLDEQSVDLVAGLPQDTAGRLAENSIQILSDSYRYPEEPILAAQRWVTGWQPSLFYLELFAPIRLNR